VAGTRQRRRDRLALELFTLFLSLTVIEVLVRWDRCAPRRGQAAGGADEITAVLDDEAAHLVG